MKTLPTKRGPSKPQCPPTSPLPAPQPVAAMTPERAHALALEHFEVAQKLGRKYGHAARRAAPDSDDLMQEGYLGLYKAMFECPPGNSYRDYGARRAKWRIFWAIPQLAYAVRVDRETRRYGFDDVQVATAATFGQEGVEFLVDRETPEAAEPSGPDPAERVETLLRLVSEKQRTAISMAYGIGGAVYRRIDVAEHMGSNHNAVCSFIRRGFDTMRTAGLDFVI